MRFDPGCHAVQVDLGIQIKSKQSSFIHHLKTLRCWHAENYSLLREKRNGNTFKISTINNEFQNYYRLVWLIFTNKKPFKTYRSLNWPPFLKQLKLCFPLPNSTEIFRRWPVCRISVRSHTHKRTLFISLSLSLASLAHLIKMNATWPTRTLSQTRPWVKSAHTRHWLLNVSAPRRLHEIRDNN